MYCWKNWQNCTVFYMTTLEHDDYIYFLKQQYSKLQNAIDSTPRDMIRNYITLLNLIQQNRDVSKEDILYAKRA